MAATQCWRPGSFYKAGKAEKRCRVSGDVVVFRHLEFVLLTLKKLIFEENENHLFEFKF